MNRVVKYVITQNYKLHRRNLYDSPEQAIAELLMDDNVVSMNARRNNRGYTEDYTVSLVRSRGKNFYSEFGDNGTYDLFYEISALTLNNS